MQCFCCGRDDLVTARKVKLRPVRHYDPDAGGLDTAAYQSYMEETTYRWSVVCQRCYLALDSPDGAAEISGSEYNMAMASRRDKAATIDEAKYQAFQRKEATKLGIDL